MTLLTVLIPTIGRGTLDRAIRSVEQQTVPCELLVSHDPDRTGCGPTLNRGLANVTTPWVATLGDDDTLASDFAAIVAEHADSADLIVAGMRHPDGSVLPRVTDPVDLAFGEVGCSYAVRAQVARTVGGWIDQPCTPTLAEDWEMIAAVRAAGGRIRIVPRVAYHVRPSGSQDVIPLGFQP